MHAPRILIVCGLAGAGKTTTAHRLAAARGGIRLCPDEWMRALDIDLYEQPARANIERLQWTLAQDLVRNGISAIIEWGTWSRNERDDIREWCRAKDIGVELHFLDVPVDELWERLRVRNEQPGEVVIPHFLLDHWANNAFEAPTPDELDQFDAPLDE